MATIDITKSHNLGLATAKERAEDLAKDLKGKLGIDYSWKGDSIDFASTSGAAKGAKGKVSVSEQDVRIEIDLPLLLRAMKGPITARVNDKLGKLLV